MQFTLTYFGGHDQGQFEAPIHHLEPFESEEQAIRRARDLMREGGWFLMMLSMDGRVLLNPQQLRLRCGSPVAAAAAIPATRATPRPMRRAVAGYDQAAAT